MCSHPSLVTGTSAHGNEAGYQRPDWKRRVAATTPSGRFPKDGLEQEPGTLAFAFPGPLVLPGDDLAYDPSHPPQSLRSWSSLKERNKVTYNRKTIYVARPPSISKELSEISEGITPAVLAEKKGKKKVVQGAVRPPRFEDTLEYLRAFYHGFEVKEYKPTLLFEPWGKTSKKPSEPSFIGLKEGHACSYTRVRVRPSPDGLFLHQLNLDDLLDGAIRVLPKNAYALLLLVDHDLYEDEEDDFCCGRAYGGSRVAVVSSARYSPLLHELQGVDMQHVWPASHCAAHVASQCGLSEVPRSSLAFSADADMPVPSSGPLHQAVAAFRAAPTSESDSDGLWLFCLARTASHELGHCLGMAHCVYYACVMQGTVGVAEDCRQPPYPCPVCAAKLTRAAGEGAGAGFDARTHEREACEVMLSFCEKWRRVGVWAGYATWLGARLGAEAAS